MLRRLPALKLARPDSLRTAQGQKRLYAQVAESGRLPEYRPFASFRTGRDRTWSASRRLIQYFRSTPELDAAEVARTASRCSFKGALTGATLIARAHAVLIAPQQHLDVDLLFRYRDTPGPVGRGALRPQGSSLALGSRPDQTPTDPASRGGIEWARRHELP